MDVPAMLTALSDSGFSDTSVTTKVRELNSAIWEIEGVAAWPFLETSVDLTFNGSSPTPTNLPTNIRTVLHARDVTVGRRVTPIRLDDLQDKWGLGDDLLVDSPRVYYPEGISWKFWPIPTAGTSVRLKYVKTSTAITDTSNEAAISIPPRWHDIIVVKALAKLYRIEDDLELAQYCEQSATSQLSTMLVDAFRQQTDQPDFVRVLDPDSWDYDL